jgi:multicomponent Na+:H+ antiporter subunit A
MLFAVLSGFLAAMVWAVAGVKIKPVVGYMATLVPAALFVYFMTLLPQVAATGGFTKVYAWVPSLGVNLSFRVDGLGLLFALLITGIGTLVFAYTIAYLKGYKFLPRFYAYLSMFMASMLGLVLSDNILALFVFWELTSISSFFLIGFKNEEPASRRSAMIALAITGFGGLFLLAGALVLGAVTGTYSIQEMLQTNPDLTQHGFYGLMVLMIFGAAFTKSAQFPFHFWLPGAMKAPTPVSTYLHSATMVKAGVYLLLRMTPLLGGHAYWNTSLIIVGGFTMLFAAFHTLFRTDLKGILAYSTISALGIMVFLIGLGTPDALMAVALFILVHALYKAALFLVTGAVDFSTGSRDVTRLSGLGKVMWPVAVAGLLAAASNAGFIPTIGFVGKDIIYEATLKYGNMGVLLTALAMVTNVLLLAAGVVAGIKPFAGKLPGAFEKVSLPPALLWVPPLLLGVLGLLFGIAPGLVDGPLIQPVLASLQENTGLMQIKLWHGFNTVLLLSLVTIGLGVALYFFMKPNAAREAWMEKWESISPEQLTVKLATVLRRLATLYTNFFQSGYLRRYVRTIILFLTILVGIQIVNNLPFPIVLDKVLELTFYEVAILGIMLLGTFFAVFTPTRLGAVAAMGVVGYSICLLFVFYSAPDLAMTQFTIDTLTVILFVLVLYKLPKYLKYTSRVQRFRDWVVALMFGAMITMIALAVLAEPGEKEVGKYYAENAYVKAKGKNIVNVILVDFRGLDTMVEITVLAIAALGVFGLLKLRMKDK